MTESTISADLRARIHEFLRGDADYDARKLLREVVASKAEVIEAGGCAPPVIVAMPDLPGSDLDLMRDVYMTQAQRAAFDRIVARAFRKWLPIATAPKDGTPIWLGDEGNMRIGFWPNWPDDPAKLAGGGWADLTRAELGGPIGLHFRPTGWQPVPMLSFVPREESSRG